MSNRRALTDGLAVVDSEEARAFVKQEPKRDSTSEPEIYEPEPIPESTRSSPTSRKKRRSRLGPNPVGLIPVTVRLRPEVAGALKRASLERQLAGEGIYSQQDLVEFALEPWLRDNGFLS